MTLLLISLVCSATPVAVEYHQSIELNDGMVRSVAFSPDSTMVAGCGDQFVQLFDTRTGEKLHRLEGHARPVLCVAFTPNGKSLISSSADQSMRVWDVRSGRQVRLLRGRSRSPVTGIAISGDGRWMVTSWRGWGGRPQGERHEIGLWDLQTGLWEHYQERFPATGEELAMHVAFSPNAKHVAVAGRAGNVVLYKLNFGFAKRFTFEHDDFHEATWAAFSIDSQKLLSCGRDNTVRVWEVNSGKPLLRIAGSNEGLDLQSALNVTDADRNLGAADMNRFDANRDGTLDRDELKRTRWLESDLARADVNADGSISRDEAIRRWARMRRDRLAATVSFQAAEFLPDGSHVVSVTRDERIQIWDANGGKQIASAKGSDKAVSSLAISADGKMLATGGAEGMVKLWRIQD